MKRKIKRRVGIFLVIAMLAVLVYPGFASIAEDESAGFIIENGELTAYTGSGGDIVIPDTVTGIRDNAFVGNMTLTSVTIPETVVSIGANAFAGCANLYSVVVPGSVTAMGNGVFSGCSSLSDLTFSANVGMIPDTTFNGCSSLASIIIPSGVASIGSDAFKNCSLLGTITIPAAVSSISDTAFTGCSNLSSITVDGGNAVYASYDGCVYNKTLTKLLYCPEGKYSVDISGNVSTLSYAAMNGCYGIKEVNIPSSVTTIENNVFSNSGVQTVTIPASVTSIGTQASWTPAMIYTYSGSEGEAFAIANNYTYELLDSPTTPTDPDNKDNDDPETPTEDEEPDPDEDGNGDGNGGTGGNDGNVGGNADGGGNTGGTGTSGGSGISTGIVSGASLATNGVRSASQLAGKQHVLDTTPTTGPELNAKVVLCLAVFFVGVYLIISSRKEEEKPA